MVNRQWQRAVSGASEGCKLGVAMLCRLPISICPLDHHLTLFHTTFEEEHTLRRRF